MLHPDTLHPDTLHPDTLHPDSLHPDSLHPTENAPSAAAPPSDRRLGLRMRSTCALSAEATAAKLPASYASLARSQSIIRRAHPGHRRSTAPTLQFVFEFWLGFSSSAARSTNA